jgi:hypothetical protein
MWFQVETLDLESNQHINPGGFLMKKLLLSLALVQALSAGASVITINSAAFPSAFDFSVEWGPGALDPTEIKTTAFQIDPTHLIEVEVQPANFVLTPPPNNVYHNNPFFIAVFFDSQTPDGNAKFIMGTYQLLLFLGQNDNSFKDATIGQLVQFGSPNPTITATPDGYGARFVFPNPPGVPEGGGSAVLLCMATAGIVSRRTPRMQLNS